MSDPSEAIQNLMDSYDGDEPETWGEEDLEAGRMKPVAEVGR